MNPPSCPRQPETNGAIKSTATRACNKACAADLRRLRRDKVPKHSSRTASQASAQRAVRDHVTAITGCLRRTPLPSQPSKAHSVAVPDIGSPRHYMQTLEGNRSDRQSPGRTKCTRSPPSVTAKTSRAPGLQATGRKSLASCSLSTSQYRPRGDWSIRAPSVVGGRQRPVCRSHRSCPRDKATRTSKRHASASTAPHRHRHPVP